MTDMLAKYSSLTKFSLPTKFGILTKISPLTKFSSPTKFGTLTKFSPFSMLWWTHPCYSKLSRSLLAALAVLQAQTRVDIKVTYWSHPAPSLLYPTNNAVVGASFKNLLR
jgi:hypothetical protein